MRIAIKKSPKGLTTELNKHMPGTVLGVCDTDPYRSMYSPLGNTASYNS